LFFSAAANVRHFRHFVFAAPLAPSCSAAMQFPLMPSLVSAPLSYHIRRSASPHFLPRTEDMPWCRVRPVIAQPPWVGRSCSCCGYPAATTPRLLPPLSGIDTATDVGCCRCCRVAVYILSPMSAIIAEMPATAAGFAVVTLIYYR
jgi:hypothetical protein